LQVVLPERYLRRGGRSKGNRRLLGSRPDKDEVRFDARLNKSDMLGDEHVDVVVGQ
jgi:hypothetical protein